MQEMQETWVQSLRRSDLLEEGMATHSSTLAWRIPWSLVGSSHTESDSSTVLKNTLPWGWNGCSHDASYLLQASDEFLRRNNYQHSCFLQYHFWKEYNPEKYLIFRLKWMLLDTSYPVGCLTSYNVIISPVVRGQVGRQGNPIVLQPALTTWRSAFFLKIN